jgi:hypothetical protein
MLATLIIIIIIIVASLGTLPSDILWKVQHRINYNCNLQLQLSSISAMHSWLTVTSTDDDDFTSAEDDDGKVVEGVGALEPAGRTAGTAGTADPVAAVVAADDNNGDDAGAGSTFFWGSAFEKECKESPEHPYRELAAIFAAIIFAFFRLSSKDDLAPAAQAPRTCMQTQF